MPHAHIYDTEGVVLRRTDFGEADRILTIFTPAHGKVRAIAKGVRRTTSRKAGHLELFTRTQLLLATGRELDIVTQAEARERLESLTRDVWRGAAAWYITELIDRFLADADPHPRLYALFIETLRRIATDAPRPPGATAPDGLASSGAVAAPEQPPGQAQLPPTIATPNQAPGQTGQTASQAQCWLALRYFELRLLDELGYRPNLHQCVNCDTPLRPEENGYSADLGGALCPRCLHLGSRRVSLNALKILRLLQTTQWSALPRLRVEASLQGEIEAILQTTLRYHLDRDLKSLAFLHHP